MNAAPLVDERTLNRTMLQRQWLDRRRSAGVVEAVSHLVGLNAQAPGVPAPALAARLEGFCDDDLWRALVERSVVRSVTLRGTQHIVTPDDLTLLRSALQPHLARLQHNIFRRRLAGADPAEIADRARQLLADGVVATRPELGRELRKHWPDAEATALGWSAQYLVTMVHHTPAGTWPASGPAPVELPSQPDRAADEDTLPAVVRRYLCAFGPAHASDIRAWSGLAGMRDVLAGMGDELRTYTDDRGRMLHDLADLALAAPDAPAPVRFLPEFDAPLLAYHDRSRIMTPEVRAAVCQGDAVHASVLVDGRVAATWERGPGGVVVHPLVDLDDAGWAAVEAEAVDAFGMGISRGRPGGGGGPRGS